jgi:hypothetical protein
MISAEHANGLTWNNIWLTAAIDEQHTDPEADQFQATKIEEPVADICF